eukprot:4203654-Amphidinium_carterae.1
MQPVWQCKKIAQAGKYTLTVDCCPPHLPNPLQTMDMSSLGQDTDYPGRRRLLPQDRAGAPAAGTPSATPSAPALAVSSTAPALAAAPASSPQLC